MSFDLNCDLGEGEPRALTARLMRYITSANIACGGHAGDVESMRSAVRLALQHGVRIGAHPGLYDRAGFGRSRAPISAAEFKTLLVQQISALERIAQDAGGRLHHIKLHGALYHMVEEQEALRRAYLDAVREFWPEAIIFSIAGGKVSKAAARLKMACWGEGFLDRAYHDANRLVPRDQRGSVLSPEEFEDRLQHLAASGTICTSQGEVSIEAKTWCIHSDSPHAVAWAPRAAELFCSKSARH